MRFQVLAGCTDFRRDSGGRRWSGSERQAGQCGHYARVHGSGFWHRLCAWTRQRKHGTSSRCRVIVRIFGRNCGVVGLHEIKQSPNEVVPSLPAPAKSPLRAKGPRDTAGCRVHQEIVVRCAYTPFVALFMACIPLTAQNNSPVMSGQVIRVKTSEAEIEGLYVLPIEDTPFTALKGWVLCEPELVTPPPSAVDQPDAFSPLARMNLEPKAGMSCSQVGSVDRR
jgi:hypothetical protein